MHMKQQLKFIYRQRNTFLHRPPFFFIHTELERLFQICWTISLLGIYSTELCTPIYQNICMRVLIALSYVVTLNWKVPNVHQNHKT